MSIKAKSGYVYEEDLKTIARQIHDRIQQVKRERETKQADAAAAAAAAVAAAVAAKESVAVAAPVPGIVPGPIPAVAGGAVPPPGSNPGPQQFGPVASGAVPSSLPPQPQSQVAGALDAAALQSGWYSVVD